MNYLEKREIKGNVKTITEKSFKIKRNPDGTFSKGQLYLPASDFYKFYIINESGFLIEEIEFGEKKLIEYDYENNRTLIKYFDKDGNLSNEFKFSKSTNDNESVDNEFKFEYDENNNLISRTDFNEDGSMRNKFEWKYNIYGENSEYTIYMADGTPHHTEYYEYRYNDEDKLVQKIVYYYHNDNGKRIRLIDSVYFFDIETGNWVIKEKYDLTYVGHSANEKSLMSSIPKTLIERKIEYY